MSFVHVQGEHHIHIIRDYFWISTQSVYVFDQDGLLAGTFQYYFFTHKYEGFIVYVISLFEVCLNLIQ